MNQPIVAVLLSSFNGEKYIDDQLQSLRNQSFSNFFVYIRDDGSTDRTAEIVASFDDSRVLFVRDDRGNIGAAQSFMTLLDRVSADIYMFCDQDDVWLPNKIQNAVDSLLNYGIGKNVLFHTDLVVVDDQLRWLYKSFFLSEGITLPEAHLLKILVVQNCVVGCTMAFTNSLKSALLADGLLGAKFAMHDWWIALYAQCKGHILYSPSADILYRQHSSNVSGASKSTYRQRVAAQFSSIGVARIALYKENIGYQSSSFLKIYGSRLNVSQMNVFLKAEKLKYPKNWVHWVSCMVSGIGLQNVYMNVSFLVSPIVESFMSIKRVLRK